MCGLDFLRDLGAVKVDKQGSLLRFFDVERAR